jgi:peroxiredoxin
MFLKTSSKYFKLSNMKRILFIFSVVAFCTASFAQDHETGKKLPAVQLKNMEGKSVNTGELGLKGPVVISFWATWCAPCKRELNTIHELYTDWQAETGVTLVAVSIDDEKTINQVPVYVNGKSWEYVVLMDPNGDFKRAMGVNNVPHTFLIDTEGNIVYSHNNYAPGDEDKLYQEILSLKEKSK